jgi:hypothetical protein
LRVRSGLEGAGKAGGGTGTAREQQDARCVAIEPVHETRTILAFEAQGVQHAVHVPRLTRSSLHRKPGRLVEDDDVVVMPHHAGADHLWHPRRLPPVARP